MCENCAPKLKRRQFHKAMIWSLSILFTLAIMIGLIAGIFSLLAKRMVGSNAAMSSDLAKLSKLSDNFNMTLILPNETNKVAVN